MKNVTECQQELIRLGFLSPTQPDGSPSDDGRAGQLTFAAFNRFLRSHGKPPIDPGDFTLTAINAALWPSPPQRAPKPPSIFTKIGAVVSIIKTLKGLKMNSITVDVKSAWLSTKNWAAGIALLTHIAAFFGIVIPPDLAPAVTGLVDSAAAVYIIVKNTWFTTTVTAASAKKL